MNVAFAMPAGFWAVRSALGESELLKLTPRLVKVCSARFVPELVKRALPGMVLTHLPVPPTAIRAEVDMQYFAVETTGPCWEHILQTRKVGVYIPGEIAQPEFDLTVIVEHIVMSTLASTVSHFLSRKC